MPPPPPRTVTEPLNTSESSNNTSMPPSRHVGLLCIYIYEDKICVFNIAKINTFISNIKNAFHRHALLQVMISKKDRANGMEMI